jgi:hypothetical protein
MKQGTNLKYQIHNLKYQIHKLKFDKISLVLGKLWGRAECCFIIWRNGRARIGVTDPMDPLVPTSDLPSLSDSELVS